MLTVLPKNFQLSFDLIIIKFRPAVQTLLLPQTTTMDNLKIHDSQLHHRNNCSPILFLYGKAETITRRKHSLYSADTDIQDIKRNKLIPTFSFVFNDYFIGEHVQYSVTLIEQYRILRKTVKNQYAFKTRYSMLEALDAKLGGMGLPGKKYFGNKNKQFIERRKVELERYLNQVAVKGKQEFYRFVRQIKTTDFNKSLKDKFILV